jgi:hypothetical protein
MSRNSGIKVGLGTSRFKYSGRIYSSIQTTVKENSTRTTPRESDLIDGIDDGAYAEDERSESARIKEGFALMNMGDE